ncbi:Heterokaryon incompatibility protein 6, OR allele [Pseudocercospora fuligena]|uniref:Heterokaryon incompatibility protein 6, OR allele n=1 Tax=Pseudocercospora fuligena TaxID=685502 RepID=A0A8H6RMK1_9PEZI|nr:Heterokaryon incompatibility protein 6, OR allele [Pseudocercospora fuligena]
MSANYSLKRKHDGDQHGQPRPSKRLLAELCAPPKDEFVHVPIHENQIRLVRVEKSSSRETSLSCSLSAYERSKAPRYVALSYCWGSPTPTAPVMVNGKVYHVRSNLHSALQVLRNQPLEHLWIDALCINQNNLPEKAQQVNQMAKTFSAAQHVLAWLGPSTTESDIAIEGLQGMLEPRMLNSPRSDLRLSLSAIQDLICRPWFNRARIVQEALLAPRMSFMCGERSLSLETLSTGIELIQSPPCSEQRRPEALRSEEVRSLMHSGWNCILDLLKSSLVRKSSSGRVLACRLSLESLVTKLNTFQCEDPRDAVHCMRSLANDGGPAVDYSKSVLEVYTEFIAHCINTSGRLDIICRPWAPVPATPWHSNLIDPDLKFAVPSWICTREKVPFPDSRATYRRRYNADSLVGQATRKVYDADMGREAVVQFGKVGASQQYDGSIHVDGKILGQIAIASGRMAEGVVSKESLSLLGTVKKDKLSGDISSISESIWRTLCANRGPEESAPPLLYGVAMVELLQMLPGGTSLDTVDLIDDKVPSYLKNFLERAQSVVWNRKTFRAHYTDGKASNDYLVGLGPRETAAGDYICILYGCSVPVVMRKHENGHSVRWELIGESYVDAMMEGEALYDLTEDEIQQQTVTFDIR